MKIIQLLLLTSSLCFLARDIAAQCPPAGGGSFDGSLTITGVCVVNGDLSLNRNNLTITSTGSLTVNGTFDNDGNGNITIDGGTLTTTGAFNNNGNGVVTVQNSGALDVGTNYFNDGNGTTNFTDGDISIGGNYTNDGNGTIDAGGLVTVGGDFTVNGNGTNTVSGGLSIGGTADLGSGGIDVSDGGVLQVDILISEGDIDIASGGTINVVSGNLTGTVNNDPANADQDCTNNCCGSQCNTTGNDLGTGGDAVLPIELLYFQVSNQGNTVLIEWASATELNNDFYTIERSYDGAAFELVTTVKGSGNSSEQKTYQTTDAPGYFGFVYYRLTQTDFDGNQEVFPLASILYNPKINDQLIYPTVLRSGEMVTIANFWGELKGVNLALVDLSGKSAEYRPELEIRDQVRLKTFGLPHGVYLLKGTINGLPIMKKLVVKD